MAVLTTGVEVVGVVPLLLPEPVEVELPHAATIKAIKSILMI